MIGPYEINSIAAGDAEELCKAIPSESIDLVIEDPPYGIGYASSRTTRNNGQLRKSDNSFGDDVFDASFIPELYRVLKADSALFLFTRWDVLHLWKAELDKAGFKVVQRIVWNKCHWKMGDLRYYGSQTEDILFCRKGVPVLRRPKRSGNLWSSSSSGYLPESQFDHPTQKAEKIISQMIVDCSDTGNIVLDTHCGSGTVAACAKKLSRNFLCFDIKAKYVEMAQNRVIETQSPLPFINTEPVKELV